MDLTRIFRRDYVWIFGSNSSKDKRKLASHKLTNQLLCRGLMRRMTKMRIIENMTFSDDPIWYEGGQIEWATSFFSWWQLWMISKKWKRNYLKRVNIYQMIGLRLSTGQLDYPGQSFLSGIDSTSIIVMSIWLTQSATELYFDYVFFFQELHIFFGE